jgi:hypothetical protein
MGKPQIHQGDWLVRAGALFIFRADFWESEFHSAILEAISRLVEGRGMPGSAWVPLQQRHARTRRSRRIAFWLTLLAALVLISIGATWLSGSLDPNGFVLRSLAVVGILVSFAAGVAQILGWRLRDPWENAK